MRTKSTSGLVIAVLLVVAAAGCTGEESGPRSGADAASPATTAPPSPTARIGQPFRNGVFEITITRVAMGVAEMPLDATATSGDLEPYKPENGQFVLVHLTAKNVGNEPASMSTNGSSIVDAEGKTYTNGKMYLGGLANQGLGEDQQPGVSKTGFLPFDVPATVTKVISLVVQSDPYGGTTNPTSLVSLS